METYAVYRYDEKVSKMFITYNDALYWMQDTLPFSWYHAFKYEGYSVQIAGYHEGREIEIETAQTA